MTNDSKFVDIMAPRREKSSVFEFMTKAWDPKKTMAMDKYFAPQELKEIAVKSLYIEAMVEAESLKNNIRKEVLKKEVEKYLDEIGLEYRNFVIRWMGVFFLKVCFMMKISVFVNEAAIFKIKDSMGNSPMLFLPTHRSYADFCLMTYLCYHYDIEFPAVAAGIDFQSMAIVGRCMRDTCGFFIRRTLVGDELYAATLRQYVRTLVTRHAAPIEFFLEGTRSRSNKSLPPKYGMLSMMLLPLFTGEVNDIQVVPVNISYERLMEHGLFAYEHLGVPKPKETTGGLLKALHSLNDNFGNIYINMGAPFSVKEYLKDGFRVTSETQKPVDLQEMTPEQFNQVQDLGNHVIKLQQDITVATITNLLALVLFESIINNRPLSYEEVLKEVNWMMRVATELGASVFENDVRASVDRILVVHSKMMRVDKDDRLKLISSLPMELSDDVKAKMKGHILKPETMVHAVPLIQLQLYVNPVLHYLVAPALVSMLAEQARHADELRCDYYLLRKLLHHEFVHEEKTEQKTFDKALQYCIENDVVLETEQCVSSGSDVKLRRLLRNSVWPALTTLVKCADVLQEQKECEHKKALKLIQERIESQECHPYCLSLDAIANCLQGLVLAKALTRHKTNEKITYAVDSIAMEKCCHLVNSVLPVVSVNFGKTNLAILDSKVASRL